MRNPYFGDISADAPGVISYSSEMYDQERLMVIMQDGMYTFTDQTICRQVEVLCFKQSMDHVNTGGPDGWQIVWSSGVYMALGKQVI